MLGMKLLRQHDNEEYCYTLAFVGYAAEPEQAVIELTYNWGTNSYSKGEGFGHTAIAVEDIYDTCHSIRQKGGKIIREPGPVLGGKTNIAFIENPDGYKIELIQAGQAAQGLG